MTTTRYKKPFVQTKKKWADKWVTIIDLDAAAWDNALAPSMSGAKIVWRYGKISPGTGTFRELDGGLNEMVGYYIRIMRPASDQERHRAAAAGIGANPLPQQQWVGLITRVDDLSAKDTINGIPTGDEIGICRGLEILLERTAIVGSYVEDSDDARILVDTVLPFNLRDTKTGAIKGNRSADKHAGDGGRESYLFSDTDGETWTAYDVIEYIVHQWGTANLRPLGIISANMSQYTEPFGPFTNVRQALNALVTRSRGHCWFVDTNSDADGDYMTINVRSTFVRDWSMFGIEIQGNQHTIDLDITDDDITGNVQLTWDSEPQFDEILVEGDPVIICDTLDMTGEAPTEIVAGWSEDQEGNYEATDDLGRAAQKFADVYRTFRITPSQLRAGPTVQDDGTLSTSTTPGQAHLGKRLLRTIPILKTTDDADAAIEFRRPLVYFKYDPGSGDKYVPVEAIRALAPNMPSAGFRMLDGEMGFHIYINPNHILGESTFSPGADVKPERQPVIDYRNIEATIAWASSERLHVRYKAPGDTIADLARVKRISVPGAQCWYRAPGVTTDIVDGARVVEAQSAELRNDKDRLFVIALMARCWYFDRRSAATVTYGRIVENDTAQIGMLVGDVVSDNWSKVVNTVISRISVDAIAGRTIVQTGFSEMDFVGMSGQGDGRPGRIPIAGLSAPAGRNEPAVGAVDIGQEPDSIAARVTPAEAPIIVERGKVTAPFASGATIEVNPINNFGQDIPNRETIDIYLSADGTNITKTIAQNTELTFARFPEGYCGADGVVLGHILGDADTDEKVSTDGVDAAGYLEDKVDDDGVWIQVAKAGGKMKTSHDGPGPTCWVGERDAASSGIITEWDIDEYGHVRYIQVCGYCCWDDGDCVGPCGDV